MSTYNAFGNNPVYYNDPSGGSHDDDDEGKADNSNNSDNRQDGGGSGISISGNTITINWGAASADGGGSIWFNNDANNGAGHSWNFSHDEALEIFSPSDWVASGGRSVLAESHVSLRKGNIGGNILSRASAAGRVAGNIYGTKWYDRNYGGDGSGSFADNAAYVADQVNQYNPIAILWDTASYSMTGEDRLGNTMSAAQANLGALGIVPIGRIGKIGSATVNGSSSLLPKMGRKLDFVFGKATGRLHNIQRSTAMQRQLSSIGIFDNTSGRTYLNSHLGRVLNTQGNILSAEGGFITRESLLMGPGGGLLMQSVWKEQDLITIILKGK